MTMTSSSTLAIVLLALAVPSALGHGWIKEPPARNAAGSARNGYCPHCGNGGGVCGDGGQWPASSNYLGGQNAGPQRVYTAGDVVEVKVQITAHHRGHMELHVCDEHLGPLTPDPEGPSGCLSKHVLLRVPPEEIHNDCRPNDARGACQPLDTSYPERWYLPPGTGEHTMHFRIPQDLQCTSCTLQWRWWTANSCIPADGYGCYFQRMNALGWDATAWCGAPSFCGTCPSSLLQANASQAHQRALSQRTGCGEEFRNCADITVRAGSGQPAPTPSPTPTPGPSPTPATTQMPATTAAPTPAPMPTPAPAGGSCVSQSVLTCINDYSSYWPKCDPGQAKNNVGPAGYEFGQYCTQEWTDALNEVLSAVGKCGDEEAIRKFLAQVAYETGYYSTVYQPRDGGAGLIHMIPGNWAINAGDMDTLWPGNGYAAKAAQMGKNFFQTPAYGWRSVAAWFKTTNRVIPGCGMDLFDRSLDEQTRCILSRVVSRQEAYDVVGRCMAQHPPSPAPATTQAPMTTMAPTPSTTMAPSPTPSPTTTPAAPSPMTTPAATTTMPTATACDSCTGDFPCIWTDGKCYPQMAQAVCEQTQGAIWCGRPSSTSEPEMEPEPEATTSEPEMEPEPEATTSEPEMEPEPEATTPAPQRCMAKPGNNGGATDAYCAQCETGYQWWPCNNAALCEGAGCIMSAMQVQAEHKKISPHNHFLGTALLQAGAALDRAAPVHGGQAEL